MRFLAALVWSGCLFAQGRTVAITVDDLPNVAIVSRKLLAAFQRHHVPVTGFVIQQKAADLGPAGPKILEEWIRRGFDLGNHTYSHPDINKLTIEEIEREIVRGEEVIGPLMQKAGRQLRYFRFPMNHTGDTKAKHDALAAFLKERGYRLATCTIDNSDYLFNTPYLRMLAKHDDVSAAKLRAEYLAYTATEIDYYAALNEQVLGYEPPQVMLLHDNRLNADVIEPLLRLFEEKGYRFVTLDAAQADPAYRAPETYITKFGPMWGYRWASQRNVKVNGSLEQDPPKWIVDYGKGTP